jgi:methenyltetrahydromethanopterin cyclohydrolase
MLAQAANKAGFMPLVIDQYADLDTRQYAFAWRKTLSLSLSDLVPSIEELLAKYKVTELVYGSGFECYPESLAFLNSRLTVYGNQPATFGNVQNKPAFFTACTELAIPYPPVSFTKPASDDAWLVKPIQGQGGVGIKRYNASNISNQACYWQKYQLGTQHSVLFLANGSDVQVIGFNTQWTINNQEDAEFVFAGIINACRLTDQQQCQIVVWIKQLVLRFGLRGLNSLDFIQDGDDSYVLEINPRPSASMQLYESDLFHKHILACQGILTEISEKQGCIGFQYIYAERDMVIPELFIWPEWCMDIPAPATLIYTGQPICSIIAQKNQPEQVLAQLMLRQQQLFKQFER